MPIQIKENSIAMHLLLYLGAAEELAAIAFMPPHKWVRWAWCGKYSSYRSAIYRLVRSGLVQITKENNARHLVLTKKGRIQALMAKARLPQPEKWDGKWRVIFFDIPEESSVVRQQLRRLLIKNGFKKMQASVYICPWPLNREAVTYLKETGLMDFIRLGRMDALDDDGDLKKKFQLG